MNTSRSPDVTNCDFHSASPLPGGTSRGRDGRRALRAPCAPARARQLRGVVGRVGVDHDSSSTSGMRRSARRGCRPRCRRSWRLRCGPGSTTLTRGVALRGDQVGDRPVAPNGWCPLEPPAARGCTRPRYARPTLHCSVGQHRHGHALVLPSSTPRVIAAVPNFRVPRRPRGRSGQIARAERQFGLERIVGIAEVGQRDPDQAAAAVVDQRRRDREQARARWPGWHRCRRSAGQRVRAGDPREVVEAQPQHDRAAHPVGIAQPPADAIDEPDQRGVDLVRASAAQPERALRADRAPPPPTCTGRGSRLCASACRCRPDARPSIATSACSSIAATSPTVGMPRSRSLAAVTRRHPTAAPPAADAGSRVRRRPARRAARRAWRPRWRPWPGTSSARPRR